eukprot:SAG11_NODE_4461_length_1887_cov_3.988814_3_plen_207_part_00
MFLKAPKHKKGGGFAFAKKKAKVSAFGNNEEEEAKRPPPAALMGFGEEEEEVKRPPPSALMDSSSSAGSSSGGAAAASTAYSFVAEVDPLDAFMSDVKAEAAKPSQKVVHAEPDELEDEDIMDGYEHKDNGVGGGGDNSDEDVYAAEKKMDKKLKAEEDNKDKEDTKGVLPPINHAEMVYMPVKKEFYREDPTIARMSEEEVRAAA